MESKKNPFATGKRIFYVYDKKGRPEKALPYVLFCIYDYALFAEPSTLTILCFTISFINARASPKY